MKVHIPTFSFWRKSAPQSAHMSFITVVWIHSESSKSGALDIIFEAKYMKRITENIKIKSLDRYACIHIYACMYMHTHKYIGESHTYSALTIAPSLKRRRFTTPTR